MMCPVCRVNLVMSERQGIEIDYCPQCRGVWLDRIVERSLPAEPQARSQPQPQAQPVQPAPQQPYPQQGYPQQGYPQQQGYGHPHPHKRRKSFLEELFD